MQNGIKIKTCNPHKNTLVQIMGNEIQELKRNYSVLPEYNECVIIALT